MSDDIQRTLGEHGAKLETLGSSMDRVEQKLELLIASENKREGGKRVIWAIAAGLGAISGGVADAFMSKLIGK